MRTGISFKFKNSYHSFMDIDWAADGSLYFMPHLEESQYCERIASRTDERGRLTLEVGKVLTDRFPLRKISCHASGAYHVKDEVGRGGRRQVDGLRMVPFRKAGAFRPFLAMAPPAPWLLPTASAPNTQHVMIALPDDVSPFIIHFVLHDKALGARIRFGPGTLLGNGAVEVVNTQHPFSLITYLTCVDHAPGTERRFPERLVVLRNLESSALT